MPGSEYCAETQLHTLGEQIQFTSVLFLISMDLHAFLSGPQMKQLRRCLPFFTSAALSRGGLSDCLGSDGYEPKTLINPAKLNQRDCSVLITN